MKVWQMFLIPVSLAVTAMSSNCTPQILDEPPDKITVHPGSSLTLSCSGTCQGSPVRLSWHFSNVSEHDVGKGAFTCINESSGEKTWCNYTLRNVKDSGWYYCKVTFDRTILLQKKSRRMLVNVAENEMEVTANPGTKTPGFIDVIQSMTFLIVSGVSALLLIMLVVMICVVQRRRRRQKAMTCPIYGNTRPPSATSRQQTSKPDTLVASRVPPQAQTPLKAKCQDVPEQDTSP